MPIKTAFVPDKSLIYCRFYGQVTLPEMQGEMQKIAETPGFDPGFAVLDDLREVDGSDVTYRDLHNLHSKVSKIYRDLGTHMRAALLLKGSEVLGYARQYQSISEVYGVVKCSIHFDEAEALAALGFRETRLGDILK